MQIPALRTPLNQYIQLSSSNQNNFWRLRNRGDLVLIGVG
jgi:hypothetical protein